MKTIAFVKEFLNVIEKAEIHPFITGGTLLGCVRHDGFIPWDDDVDFGLIREEYTKLVKFCEKNFVVIRPKGSWVNQNGTQELKQVVQGIKENPGKIVLFEWPDLIKVAKGSSETDVTVIDFFSYDYYADGYTIEEHIQYLNAINEKKQELNNLEDIRKFLAQEIKINPNIREAATAYIGPGIDHTLMIAKAKWERTRSWLLTEDIFPLRKVLFENVTVFAPNHPKAYLEFEYAGDYMDYPDDVGLDVHGEFWAGLTIK